MRIVDLIAKKRDNKILTKDEIDWMIKNYTGGIIKDYQMSAMLMAIYLNNMTKEESVNLTMAIVDSGEIIDLTGIKGIKVDKHSTGGVGDKTTIVLAPLVASLGIPVAKMSGRGLGHTGGTVDKLEAIEGFKTELPLEKFTEQVNEYKIAVAGQTANLAPADKKLYALRDVTATVSSIPLIASSIMSKKIASGSNAIVLDVKVGNGAFMKTIDEAKKLARAMVDIGNGAGRKTTALITGMTEPLGYAVGNTLEIIESIEMLKGNGPKDLIELVLELGSHMVVNAGFSSTYEEAKGLLKENIENGKGLEMFKTFVKIQGGDEKIVDDYSLLGESKEIIEVISKEDGYIKSIEAEKIGICAMKLGAGRETKEDKIDMTVGIKLKKKQSDAVKKGEVLAYMYVNNDKYKDIHEDVVNSFNIVKEKCEKEKLIYDTIE